MGLPSLPRLLLIICLVSPHLLQSQVKKFVSIDCGGSDRYTDPVTGLQWVSDKDLISFGKLVKVTDDTTAGSNTSKPYQWGRDFTSDSGSISTGKYCYKLGTEEHSRYLIRATFKYRSLEDQETYPKFKLYLDATLWATVIIDYRATLLDNPYVFYSAIFNDDDEEEYYHDEFC